MDFSGPSVLDHESADNAGLRLRDLGSLGIQVDSVEALIRGAKPTRILATLLVNANHRVSVDVLLDAVWGEQVSDSTVGTLESSRTATQWATVLGSHPASTAAECAQRVRSYTSRMSMISLPNLVNVPPVGLDECENRRANWPEGPLMVDVPGDPLSAHQEKRVRQRRPRCPRTRSMSCPSSPPSSCKACYDRPVTLGARGWDSQLWRLGDDLATRLPWATETADALLLKEKTWLPVLAPLLPLPIPVPQRLGEPPRRFPRRDRHHVRPMCTRRPCSSHLVFIGN
jgi:hypothetical protein